jgi:hypothetical protein
LDRLWVGQCFQIESHMALATLAGSGLNLSVGIGTALAALRTPYDAALQARSLALALDQEVLVAYGASDADFFRLVTGRALEHPAAYMSAYARLVRRFLDGDKVTSDYERLETVAAQLPKTRSFQVRVGLGVVRPIMARWAGAAAQFIVTWLTPPNYLERTLIPALALRTGLPPYIVTYVAVAVDRAHRNSNLIAQAGSHGHLSKAHYTEALQRAGVAVDSRQIASSARQLVDSGVYLYGTVDDIVEGLSWYTRVGVDEVVLNTSGVSLLYGEDEAMRDIAEVASAARLRLRAESQ